MATERLQVNLPPGFDPARHMDALTKQIEAAHGDGWEITHIDSSANAAVAIRQVAVTEVADAGDDKPDSFEVKLAKGTKPSDAERMVTRLEDQYDGFVVTKFEPFLGVAELTKLDRATVRARGAAANALGSKPWDVPIRRRTTDEGWDIELPDTYTPSRHYDKLVEVAEEIIGTVGWTVEADADLLTCSFVPGEPPTFPGSISYPFDEKVPKWEPGGSDDWARIPLGWNLTRRADDPTDLLLVDTEASPHGQVSGTSGSGKSVMLNALIAGALARGFETVLVDLPAKAVDFFWMREFCRPHGGWGCHSLDEAVTAMALVYEEGERRARVIAEAGVTKWTELPADKQFPPILIVVDEVTGLFIQETVPKGLDKDHPLVVEAKEINTKKAMLEAYIARTAAEMRFVGLKLVLSSQVSSTTTGVSTAIRLNLGNRVLLGTKPTDNNRRLSLSDAAAVPKVPEHIASDKQAGRGVGVSEFEGQPPTVFKSFFATTDQYRDWLLKMGVPTTDSPRPRPADVAKRTAMLQPSDTAPAGSDGRSPISGEPVADIAERLGDDTSWQHDPETGEKLSGYALSNAARHKATVDASAQTAARQFCSTCGSVVNPSTGECSCSA